MKRSILKEYCLLTILLVTPVLLRAQVIGQVPSPFESIEQNSVSIMESYGDTLWIGPGLNRNIGNSQEWMFPEGADSVTMGRGRLFSLELARDTVIAGLGFTDTGSSGSVQTGIGYHTSTDGGDNWNFEPLPLDESTDTTFVYGDLHPKIFGDMVDKLNALIQNDQIAQVAGLMNLAAGQAEKIKDFVKVSSPFSANTPSLW